VWATQRSALRQALRLPLYFRDVSNDSDLIYSETANVSQTGLFMPSRVRLRIGALLSLSVQIPTDISGSYRCYFHSAGSVVHERELPLGVFGYGVKFEGTLRARQLTGDPMAAISKGKELCNELREKRHNLRHALRLPVSIRSSEALAGGELPAQTLNISRFGMLLASPVPLKVGSLLSVSLHGHAALPQGIHFCGQLKARVVHGGELAAGGFSYGVEIEQVSPVIRAPDGREGEAIVAWG
jgi:hypothetical protein